MIALQDVGKVYTLRKDNHVLAVRDATLEIGRGEFAILTGRSGSGKTILLNLIAGLTRPTSGRVILDGRDLWRVSDRQRSLLHNQTIGFIFQFPSLLPSLTALANVALPTIFGLNGAQAGAYDRAAELLRTMGLGDKLKAYPRQLSAGQQQRVVVARALLNQPQLLLADEPTSDLDEQTEREIMDPFGEIHAQTGVTIVMVTHTTQLIRYGTRSIRMAGGQIVETDDVPLDQTLQGGVSVRQLRTWSFGILGFAFALSFGRWAQSLFTVSELIHFSVNFPGGGSAQTMSCCDLGGPWARERDPDWNDYSSGGILTWGEEGEVVVDVGRQGFVKRTLQPHFVSLSSHWLRNVGVQPYQIRLEMDMCGWDLEWETFERDWDPVAKTSTRMIEPGKTFNMDWYFHIPAESRQQSVVCEGQLSVYNAQNDDLLSELPIRIVNSRAG